MPTTDSHDDLAEALSEGTLTPSEALRIAGTAIADLRREAQPLQDTLEGFTRAEKRYRTVAEQAMQVLRQRQQIGALLFEWVEPGRNRPLQRTFTPAVVEQVIVALRDQGHTALAALLDAAGTPEAAARPYLRITTARATAH